MSSGAREWPDPQNFWSRRRVVVTGGAGFLGSYVVDKLRHRKAAEIFVPRQSDYDLTDVRAIRQMLRNAQPDIVIHLAALAGGIEANRQRPAEFFYQNLVMGVQLLHECYEMGIEKFVGVGTVCSYPKHARIPFKETDLWKGYPEETNAPYGLAKKMLLVQGQAYHKQYGFNAIHLLPVNLYGPGDNFDFETSHVIPAFIRRCIEAKLANQEVITVWGSGLPTREFLYVEDAAEGIILGAERYNKPDPINLGSNFEISIRDLIKTIAELTGYRGLVAWDRSKPDGQPRRKLDTTLAENLFGFRSVTSLHDGLARTIEWYRSERMRMAEAG